MFRIQEMTWALKAESIRTILVTVGVDYKAEHRQDTGGNSPSTPKRRAASARRSSNRLDVRNDRTCVHFQVAALEGRSEAAVVADQDHRSPVVHQGLLELLRQHRRQVVGRLVEQ